jgi:hypothetical protein
MHAVTDQQRCLARVPLPGYNPCGFACLFVSNSVRTLAIGTTLCNISFDITGAHLNIDIGVVVLDILLALDTAPSAPAQGYGLSSDSIWTT